MTDKPITVTSPLLPDLNELNQLLAIIWDSKYITNNGHYHQELEQALASYLKVPYISLFTNGTLPLITALQAAGIKHGEVITTPYSFVATTHSIWWNGLTPVFVDVDPVTCNIDPQQIEQAITDKTVAIMPVHCYGTPCDTVAIQKIADRYHLKVIYDAAHAFGVEQNGISILTAGDFSTLSFHATKVYNTIEGGAIVTHSAEMKQEIDYLKNFGFQNETTVVGPGINSKMDEIRAAYGLLNLKKVDKAIAKRKHVAQKYRLALKDVPGIKMLPEPAGNVRLNYSYFPIFIDKKKYGISRDELYFKLKDHGILGRRYFYPLISSFKTYSSIPSAAPSNLPVATELAETVICLPMHHLLNDDDIEKIINAITQ